LRDAPASRARAFYERALAISEKAVGPKHPLTARSLNNLASLLQAQGDLAGARLLYERALAIRENTLEPRHPYIASSLRDLANLLQAQGDLAGARPLYERALATREKALGPDHPDTAKSLKGLAQVLQGQGDLAGAERALSMNELAIKEKVYGSESPNTAASLNRLAGLFEAQGDLTAARPLYERALTIYEKALGPGHPVTATLPSEELDALLHQNIDPLGGGRARRLDGTSGEKWLAPWQAARRCAQTPSRHGALRAAAGAGEGQGPQHDPALSRFRRRRRLPDRAIG